MGEFEDYKLSLSKILIILAWSESQGNFYFGFMKEINIIEKLMRHKIILENEEIQWQHVKHQIQNQSIIGYFLILSSNWFIF